MDKNLAPMKCMCKYHIVFTPKYRRKVICNEVKKDIVEFVKDLCKWKGVEIIERKAIIDQYPFAGINTAEDKHREFHGISEGEKCDDDIRSASVFEIQVWEQAFLVAGVLCQYSRVKWSDHSEVCT